MLAGMGWVLVSTERSRHVQDTAKAQSLKKQRITPHVEKVQGPEFATVGSS